MMMGMFLFGGLLLAFIFGRNNFGNVFGSAVGTGILSLRTASFLTIIFLLLGALMNSAGTTNTMSFLMHFNTLVDACVFSLIVAFVMYIMTHWGIPGSIAQISVGALVGWNLAFSESVHWNQISSIAFGWFYSPLISAAIAFIIFKGARFYLSHYPIPILYRDIWVRIMWIFVGAFAAYSLGANNMPVLTMPFNKALPDVSQNLSLLFSIVAGIGCLLASKKVIRMVSKKLFPLSSVESLIVGFSSALTLLLFSFKNWIFPALPISMSASMIGAIVGVSFGKGGYGLKVKTLFSIIASWIWAPLFSGLLCFGFAIIMSLRGI